MLIHNYTDDGFYIGSTEARESPLEPGVFLIPRNAVEEAPPTFEQGFLPKWNGTAWELIDVSLQQEGPVEETSVPKTKAEQLLAELDATKVELTAAKLELNDLKTKNQNMQDTLDTVVLSML